MRHQAERGHRHRAHCHVKSTRCRQPQSPVRPRLVSIHALVGVWATRGSHRLRRRLDPGALAAAIYPWASKRCRDQPSSAAHDCVVRSCQSAGCTAPLGAAAPPGQCGHGSHDWVLFQWATVWDSAQVICTDLNWSQKNAKQISLFRSWSVIGYKNIK
jgi:hypothetical protein